ncbi:NAD-dependent epimerase [Sphaerisporangium siamense]|uniref:Nucleoside-diphosphate-sugar epimerase n=1 Tax=Sphaerisporangium siamense TaxID=795645 RepID=A0A7W7D8Y1_9ACTN|nr:NAD-dependent epimerase/dehydratase family protein [Sphaerisporangium siamense]MBB4702478.1 nucleoside-diphosphate-sugar epimerase [Sphaerisporangium siamense]GII88175.1 NAD-dependent epimerase [Sphaerisporangium siamense]
MLVSVTGGTGFVGAHSVAAFVRDGHRVRLLVRDPAKAARVLAPLGVDAGAVELVPGDVTDEPSVARATRGAEAVLHAASVYSFDSRRHAETRRTNERGTAVVLGAARRAGVRRVLHVSSVAALFPGTPGPGGRVIDADSPVGRPRETYMASKAAAEAVARAHQEDGAPVVITYPPALLGPHDPNLGDQTSRLRAVLRGLTPMWPGGGFPLGDVRDTAELHARLLTAPDDVPGRHFGPGRYLTTRAYVDVLREVTGRALPAVFLPAAAMLPAGALAGLLQRVWPWHIPAEYGAIYTCACATRVAGHASTYGIAPRPVAETAADTVRWLHETGRLTAGQAGAAARRPGLVSGGAR